MKKSILLTALFAACFTVYKLYPFGDNEPQITSNNRPTQSVNAKTEEIIKSSDKPNTYQSEQLDLKTDLEKVWANLDREIPVATYLDELILASNQGNPHAKYHLAYIQRFCSSVPENEEGLNSRLSNIQNPEAVQEITNSFVFCEEYPRDMFSKRQVIDMIMDAARKGNAKAKVEFAAVAFEFEPSDNVLENAELIVELKQEAVQHLYDAKRMGEKDALYSLARAYKNGDLVKKNLVEAYAYYSAYQIIDPYISLSYERKIGPNLTNEEILLATKKGEKYTECCL